MKHIALSLVVLLLLLAGLTLGASYLLKSTVEDTTREVFLSLAAPGETAIENVTFSPLSREITISGWRTRHQAMDGPMSAHATTVHGQVTLRGIFACMPILGDLLNTADTYVPLLDRVQASHLVWTSNGHRGETAHVETGIVQLRYGLLQQYVKGLRPPFVQAVTGYNIERIRAKDLTLFLTALNGETFRAGRVNIENLSGTGAGKMDFADVTLEDDGSPITCAQLSLENIHLSSALLSELVALSSHGPKSDKALDFLMESLLENGPLVGRVTIAKAGQSLPAWTMERCEITWQEDSTTPLHLVTHIRNLRIPVTQLQNAVLPLATQGLDAVQVDADLTSKGYQVLEQSGLVRLKNLGDLDYGYTFDNTNLSAANIRLQLRDYGLTARLARTITPDAHAACMLLKAECQSLCARDPEDRKAACSKLADFVDAPGTLTLKSASNEPMNLFSLLAFLGNFGTLFDVDVVQGKQTLSQQSQDIFGGR